MVTCGCVGGNLSITKVRAKLVGRKSGGEETVMRRWAMNTDELQTKRD